MISRFGLRMLLISCAVALEMYDENRAFGMDSTGRQNYNQEENYDYENLGPYRPETRDDHVQNLMLYQLFNSLQNKDDVRLRMPYRPKFSMVENPLAGYGHAPYSELMNLKSAVVKRGSAAPGIAPDSANNDGKQGTAVKPKQANQKGRNGRKGRLSICYLKLCSYPRPVIEK